MKTGTWLVLVLLSGVLVTFVTGAPIQDASGDSGQASAEATPPEQSSPAAGDEPSDAERLLRMQQVLGVDEVKLERLRSDLASREAFLDLLTGRMAVLQATRDELQARLDASDPGSEEAGRLQEQSARLEQEYDRFNRHSTLTFEAERALRSQIEGLEGKIQTDRQALAVFRGTVEPDQGGPAPPRGATPSPAPSPEGPGAPLPGMFLPPTSTVASSTERSLLPETPEQIAARQELEQKRREARTAEEAVVTFVRRKEALEGQIDLEQTLLQVDTEALENLKGYVAEREEWLERRLAGSAPEEEIASLRAQLERLTAETQRVEGEVARRRLDLESLQERLEYATSEQNRVAQVAEERREVAEAARKWLVWLESPLYPGNVKRWAVERGPRVLAVLVLAGLLLLILRFSLRRIARAVVKRSRKAKTAVNRADTLALSFESLSTTLILAACVLLVLQEAGIDVQTVLGGAAILGVAIAFGAQNLMRDYFTGFMMLLEDQYELGDLVTIGNITGTVERVNMRVTMLRDLEGRVHFIPNGQIGSLTNRTYDWARALVEIPVDPRQDVDKVMALLVEVAEGLTADPAWADDIVDAPQMLGVDKFTESGVVIKLLLKTEPDRMFPVRRELLRRVKKAFDQAGIEPGFPVRVLRDLPRRD